LTWTERSEEYRKIRKRAERGRRSLDRTHSEHPVLDEIELFVERRSVTLSLSRVVERLRVPGTSKI